MPALAESPRPDPADPVDPVADAPPPRWRGGWANRLEVIVPFLLLIIVTLTGATTSSIGIDSFRENPDEPQGVMWGEGQPIRTDEWLTQAPIELAVLATGRSQPSWPSQEPDLIYQISSGGWFESLMFFEGNLLRFGPWLPDAPLFAAFRIFPLFLLLLSLPPLLRRMGATRPLAWLAVSLAVLNPASAWWSFMPVRILAFSAGGSYALVLARDAWLGHRRKTAIAWAGLAGLLLARLVSYYFPWSVTVGVPLVVTTVAFLLAAAGTRRAGAIVIGVGAIAGVAVLGGMIWDNLPALRAELGTVYPGQRRSTGVAAQPLHLFGAPGLRLNHTAFPPVFINQSENATAYTICLIWAAVIWRWMRPAAARAQHVATVALAISLAIWIPWITISWNDVGTHVPLFNLVPSMRVLQTLGVSAGILLCLVLSRVPRRQRALSLTVAAACAVATAYGVSDVGRAIPILSFTEIVVASLVTGTLIAILTYWRSTWGVLLVAAGSLVLVAPVNPIIFGLGDLRDGHSAEVAQRIAADARARGVTVAADHTYTGGLLIANGAPMLSGNQVTGPKRARWAVLDPTGGAEEAWNRGASYLVFHFDGRRGAAPEVTSPHTSTILVSVDPCTLRKGEPRLGYIVSNFPKLDYPCLTQTESFTWGGDERYVYRVGDQSGT